MRIAAANYPVKYHESLPVWEAYVEGWLRELAGQEVDIAVFPEYGSVELVSLLSRELQQDAYAQIRAMEEFHGAFLELYSGLARRYGMTVVAPSYPLRSGEKMINRAYVFGPSGLAGYQDKLFMTPFESREWGVSAGEPELTLFRTDKGSFGIQICYDSEFGIGAHELVKAGAGVILVPSCTETIRGATRVHVGARARALENQCYTLVSQTMGEALWTPAVDYNYGYCGAYSTPDTGFPELGMLQTGTPQRAGWMIQDFDLTLLDKVREEGGVLNFRDSAATSQLLNGERLVVREVEVK
ncbi:MAG: carbon-nitrogen hydrolase family protein [Leadbetterella sp.]|nr:carbon-nitrogen hydrolase family protein [Leadbetterella sp.]